MKFPRMTWKQWRLDLGGAAVMVGLTLAACLVWVVPARQRQLTNNALNAEISTINEKIAHLQRSLGPVQDQLRAAVEQREKSRVKLEGANRLNQRLGQITRLAGETGVEIDAMEAGKETPGAAHGTMSIRITAHGGFAQAIEFLHRVRLQFVDTAVPSVEVTAPSPGARVVLTAELLWHTAPTPLADTR